MRHLAISLLTLVPLTGCMSLHADLPEDAVRHHMAREDGIQLAAICLHDGQNSSEGAIACMAGRRMSCGPTGRWVPDGNC